MSKSHEQIHPEGHNLAEKQAKTIDSFIEFTKGALSHESHSLDVEWEYQMHRLFGDSELLQITKNQAYRGIPGIRRDLTAAYETGGLLNLKAIFFVRAIEHTDILQMGDAAQTAFRRIIDFK